MKKVMRSNTKFPTRRSTNRNRNSSTNNDKDDQGNTRSTTTYRIQLDACFLFNVVLFFSLFVTSLTLFSTTTSINHDATTTATADALAYFMDGSTERRNAAATTARTATATETTTTTKSITHSTTVLSSSSLSSSSLSKPININTNPNSTTATVSSMIRPGAVWKDTTGNPIDAHGGGILYHNNMYYWYGELKSGRTYRHKRRIRIYLMGISCYSSTNLVDWTFVGNVLPASLDKNHDLHSSKVVERPKVVYNAHTHKFVMWMHIDNLDYRAAKCGVAVSDTPEGPFQYVRSFRPNAHRWPLHIAAVSSSSSKNSDTNYNEYNKDKTQMDLLQQHPLELNKREKRMPKVVRDYETGQMSRDFTIFEDDDNKAMPKVVRDDKAMSKVVRDYKTGQMSRDFTIFVDNNDNDDEHKAYLFSSSEDNLSLHLSELSEDYLSTTGKYTRLFIDRCMEAPAVFQRQGTYYLVTSGCTRWKPNAARLAVSQNSIWGPWIEKDNPCQGKDRDTTYHSQSTFVLPIPSAKEKKNDNDDNDNDGANFVFLADRWNNKNLSDSRYVWLPLQFHDNTTGDPFIQWHDEWSPEELFGNTKMSRK